MKLSSLPGGRVGRLPLRKEKLADNEIPNEAMKGLQILEACLGSSLVAVYLYGSAVAGGLRKDSDIDLFVIVSRGLNQEDRTNLAGKLMNISGKIGNAESVRPLEVTVVDLREVVTWKYPPKKEFIYGEWLRDDYERGLIPGVSVDPDLAILLSQVRSNSIPLSGTAASELLDPVPMEDVRKAMRDSLPELIGNLKGDERNVILTLARMWVTAATGKFVAKDEAARWVITRLPEGQAALVDLAGKAYRGECIDNWEDLDTELAALVDHLKMEIASCLG